MAKTKKETKKETTKATPINTTTFGYSGNLAIKIQDGKKTLLTKNYHNAGCKLLFKFICNCLAGEFTEMARPCRIRLFSDAAVTPVGWEDNSDKWTNAMSLTAFLLNDSAPIVSPHYVSGTSGVIDYYQTTFHFRIPASFLTADNIPVKKAALYSRNGSDLYESRCAYFLFTGENANKELAWDPIDPALLKDNYSVILEWTMAVFNQPTSSQTTNQAN